ncbi:MAG: response regulator [Candidatus Omnitrophota bacterium]|nr:response regulator [Candidatus Omnitrophota bacterium]
MPESDLLSIDELIEILGVSRESIDQLLRSSRLYPTYIDGAPHFHPDDVRTLFDECGPGSVQRKRRILVIDDESIVSRSVGRLLEKAGFEVETAGIGLSALDLISRRIFDLVIMDIRMPGMNGIEALKAIRALRKQFGKTPLPEIILTGFHDPHVRKEAEQMGVVEFMHKPFDAEELLAAVRKNLKTEMLGAL